MRRTVLCVVLFLATGCRGKHHVVIDDWVPPPDAATMPRGPTDDGAGAEEHSPRSAGAAGPEVGWVEPTAAVEPDGADATADEEAEPGPDADLEAEALTADAGDGPVLPGVPGYGVVERADDGTVAIPPENRERGTRPGPESAEALARVLLAAIAADDPSLAVGTVFPLEAFEVLKDLRDPGAYLQRMIRWYGEDVHAERGKLGRFDELTYERFQFGYCTWQEEQTEGNLLPYWSCRHNKLYARAGTRPVTVEIHALINWGTNWYIAHLGPVRR